MMQNRPMKIRLAFSGACFGAVFGLLYLEEWLAFWFPKFPFTTAFVMTALAGAYLSSLTLPHPRQERKRRERQMENMAQTMPAIAQEYWNSPEGIARLKAHDEETLAEKRP